MRYLAYTLLAIVVLFLASLYYSFLLGAAVYLIVQLLKCAWTGPSIMVIAVLVMISTARHK